jgi:hypothetical protein
MSRSAVASTSNLQITVEPSQSSFFAGEDFSCIITFINTLLPTPQSVPLPTTATFDDRRVASYNPKATPTLPVHPSISSLSAQHRRKHSKSQSVDVRTFARRNQLHAFGGADDELGSEEGYYKNVAEERSREDEEMMKSGDIYQELLESLPRRKDLIGRGLDFKGEDPRIGKERKQNIAGPSTSTPAKRHSKAYSLALPGRNHDHLENLGKGRPENGYLDSPRIASQHVLLQANIPSPSPSRHVSSTLRQPSGPIAANHPHSRKKSVAQVQSEDLSATFELEGGSSPGADNTPTQSTAATPRESLDIRGRTDEGRNGFYELGENSTMESVLREDFTQWSQADPSRTKPTSPLFDQKGGCSPGTETLLWSFAQFGGSFQIDESLIKPGEFEQVKEKLAGSTASPSTSGARMQMPAVGGGEFGAAAESGEDRSAEGWGSYLRGVLSGGGGGGGRGARRSSLSVPSASHRRTASTLGDMRAKTLTSKTIPIFSNPPSMVAVDLQLAPGESRSYTFRIPLPPDLPPSYSGRSISFVYTLTLGTNRLFRTKRGTLEPKSRLVRIPLRIYNLVNITGVTSFFDLTNPIINLKDYAETREEGTLPTTSTLNGNESAKKTKAADNLRARELAYYTEQLVLSCKDEEQDDVPTDVEVAVELARKQARNGDGTITMSPHKRSHLQLLPDLIAIKNARSPASSSLLDSKAGLGLQGEDDDLPKNSLQAVEVLSRNSPKVSYDISKDGQIAAVLTLVKSKYRLGDTIHGVVTINAVTASARVVRLAATLESHEEIESTLSTLPANRAQRMTRKIYSEFHENTLQFGQVGFSLPIPSGATPDFNTSAVKLAWTVRLSLLMLSSASDASKDTPPPYHLVPSVDDGFSTFHRAFRAAAHLASPNGGKLEVVECAVPLTILAHSTRFTAGEVAFTA